MTDRLDNCKGKNVKALKNWLVLSHGFNMDGRAASLTVTDKIPYLLKEGIHLHVLSAITGIKDTRFPHQQLIAWGPAALRFDFRHWFANRFGRNIAYKIITPLVSAILAPFILIEKLLFGYSSQWSWAFPAYFNGLKLINEGKVNLVYSSGGAWSAHLAGLWLKKKTKLPWIVEIHDPLVIRNNEEDVGKDARKKTDARKRYWLEREICQYADIVWWFTDNALYYAEKRNPNLGKTGYAKALVITPGAKPPDIEKIKKLAKYKIEKNINICHFGSLADDRSLSQIMRVLPQFFQEFPSARSEIKFHVYGASLDKKTKKNIINNNYQDIVVSHGRLETDNNLTGRQKIAIEMIKADVLLLLHGDATWCEEYIPSKVYDYFWINKPIWGIVYRNEKLKEMLLERKNLISDAESYESILKKLIFIWKIWKKGELQNSIFMPITPETGVNKIMDAVKKIEKSNNIK